MGRLDNLLAAHAHGEEQLNTTTKVLVGFYLSSSADAKAKDLPLDLSATEEITHVPFEYLLGAFFAVASDAATRNVQYPGRYFDGQLEKLAEYARVAEQNAEAAPSEEGGKPSAPLKDVDTIWESRLRSAGSDPVLVAAVLSELNRALKLAPAAQTAQGSFRSQAI